MLIWIWPEPEQYNGSVEGKVLPSIGEQRRLKKKANFKRNWLSFNAWEYYWLPFPPKAAGANISFILLLS